MRFYACCIDVKRVPMALKRPSITSMKSLNFHLIYFLNTTQQETYRGRNHDLDGFKMPAVSDNIDEVNTTDPHDMFVPHEMFELRTGLGFRV